MLPYRVPYLPVIPTFLVRFPMVYVYSLRECVREGNVHGFMDYPWTAVMLRCWLVCCSTFSGPADHHNTIQNHHISIGVAPWTSPYLTSSK